MGPSLPFTRDDAEARDRSDPLAPFRERFVIPDETVVYLDGNSLGRLPRATLERLGDVVESEWGGRLIRGWCGLLARAAGARRRSRRRACRSLRGTGDHRRLDERVSVQACVCRSLLTSTRVAERSWWRVTSSLPIATCSRAWQPRAGSSCAGSTQIPWRPSPGASRRCRAAHGARVSLARQLPLGIDSNT